MALTWRSLTERFPSERNRDGGRRRRLRAFTRDDRGTTAVEFAMIAFPFFIMIAIPMEIGLSYFSQRMLSHGADQTVRKLRIGALRSDRYTDDNGNSVSLMRDVLDENGDPTGEVEVDEAELKKEICRNSSMFLFNCQKLIVDVRTIASWDSYDAPENGSGVLDADATGFAPGGRSSVNVLKFYYPWPRFFDWRFKTQSANRDREVYITASTAFMTEPID